jgi:hypothetical protein
MGLIHGRRLPPWLPPGGRAGLTPGAPAIPVGVASDYNFARMAEASCSSAERDGGVPAGATATRR